MIRANEEVATTLFNGDIITPASQLSFDEETLAKNEKYDGHYVIVANRHDMPDDCRYCKEFLLRCMWTTWETGFSSRRGQEFCLLSKLWRFSGVRPFLYTTGKRK